MSGVDEQMAVQIKGAGIDTVEEMASVTVEQLTLLAGLEAEQAEELIATAQATLEELRKQVEEMIEREKAEQSRSFFDQEIFGEEAGEAEKKLEEKDIFGEQAAAGEGDEKKKEDGKKLTEEDIFRGESSEE